MTPTSSGKDWPAPGHGAPAPDASTDAAPPREAGPSGTDGWQPVGPSARAAERSSNRRALIRLVSVVAAGVVLAVVLHGLAILIVVVSLIAMVMLHELGHFVTAKLSGMKVTEFFLGFGPRLWSVRRGETEYGVKAIPAGGYNRIIGMTNLEEVDPADEPRTYRQASFPRRFLVGIAGSAMHFIIAFGLLWGMCAFSGLPVGSATTTQVSSLVAVANGSGPAERAGLRPGDTIVAVDGHKVSSVSTLRKEIETSAGHTLIVEVRRGSRLLDLRLTPMAVGSITGSQADFGKLKPTAGVIGVQFAQVTLTQTWNPIVAVAKAGSALGTYTRETGDGLAQVFSFHGLGSFFHQVATASSSSSGNGKSSASSSSSSSNGEVLSTVGAAEVAVQAAHRGVSQLLLILVAINLFVGMANLFPMLPLDGGHVVIACYERIRSRRGRPYHADVAKLMPLAYLFLALIVVIGLGALYVNLLHPPSIG
ncbi:MAG: peptidase [Acidimicrobiaceae bacterium]|nr:peptidase [Acidimicrobiaceae bacterium]